MSSGWALDALIMGLERGLVRVVLRSLPSKRGGEMKKRMISPDFWTDGAIVAMSAMARLFFIGLWQCADDWGRVKYDPKRLKLKIFPADRVHIEKLVDELEQADPDDPLITLYEVNGVKYLYVTKFSKHQRIDKRRESKYPAPDCADSRQFAGKFPVKPEPEPEPEPNQNKNQNQKEREAGKPAKIACGEFENVKLTEDEIGKLVQKFGKTGAWDRINRLSGYMRSLGKEQKYRDHYATILSWARREDPKETSPPGKRKSGLEEFANEKPTIDITP